MSFTGFYPETIDFLWGIRLNNHREWFEAHKADYQRFLWEPMKALAADVETMRRVLVRQVDEVAGDEGGPAFSLLDLDILPPGAGPERPTFIDV